VYLNGELRASTTKEDAPQLPENYGKESKMIGEQQAYIAGYRLLNLLD